MSGSDGHPRADLPAVEVRLPGLLTRFTAGRRTVTVHAGTVAGCLDELVAAHPALDPHLFDSAGDLRAHLHLLHNGTRVGFGEHELETGDELVVLQAVSGG